jgi:hypothetical protein
MSGSRKAELARPAASPAGLVRRERWLPASLRERVGERVAEKRTATSVASQISLYYQNDRVPSFARGPTEARIDPD